MNDIGIFGATSTGGYLKRPRVHRYCKEHLQEYHGGGATPGSVLTQAGAKLSKGWSAIVRFHRGETLPPIFLTRLLFCAPL